MDEPENIVGEFIRALPVGTRFKVLNESLWWIRTEQGASPRASHNWSYDLTLVMEVFKHYKALEVDFGDEG